VTSFAELLPVAEAVADLASELMRTRQPGVLTAKGDRDMASEVDYEIERRVRTLLLDRTPRIGFLGEEEGAVTRDGDLYWALDPVDGTANFIHALPTCGVSLGLVHKDRPVLGMIDLPFLRQRYWAVEQGGAYTTGERLRASTTAELRDALVGIGDFAAAGPGARMNPLRLAIAERLAARAQRVRMHGSAALDLAWLAAGKLDATISLSNKAWDVAAGVIIAREAGAVVFDQDGSSHTTASAATIGATPTLVSELLDLIQDATHAVS
jgi:myo-inositol-1(or 4)-monophosphatase